MVREGRRFEIQMERPGKSPPLLCLRTPAGPVHLPPQPDEGGALGAGPYRADAWPQVPCPQPFELRPETGTDRVGKRLRLNREFQVGDPDFDRQVYIECDAPEPVLRALLTGSFCSSALPMVTSGERILRLDHLGRLELKVKFSKPDPSLTLDETRELLGELGAMASGMPALCGVWRDRSAAGWLPVIAIGWGVLSLPVAMLVQALWGSARDEPVTGAFWLGATLWALSLPAAYLLLRGRSTSLRDLILCSLFNAWGFPLLVLVLSQAINGAWLPEPVLSRPLKIEKTWLIKGKSQAKTFHARLTGPSGAPLEVKISERIYLQAGPGHEVSVHYREGRLGWELVERVELIQARPAAD
jgi:hypothetical protein